MDRVFPKNMDPIDRNDEKKAIGVLEDYVRYMKEQIEWAVSVILTLNGGTSLAKVAMDIETLKTDVGVIKQSVNDVARQVGDNRDNISGLSMELVNTIKRSDLVTEIDQDSTDDTVPTAKAVYDFVSGGN